MKRLSDLASPKVVRASLPSDEDKLLGKQVRALGHQGEVDEVTMVQGKGRYRITVSDGQRLDNVGRSDIEVVEKKQWYQ